jgi:hypothetical protein
MDQSDLDHKLVPLEVGEEYELSKDLRVRPFKTYHVVPSQVLTTNRNHFFVQFCVFLNGF